MDSSQQGSAAELVNSAELSTRHIDQDGARIELVIDQGEIIAGCRTMPICEVELELKAGSPAPVFALARALDAVAPLQLSALSKAQLGYQMLDGSADEPARWMLLSLAGEMATFEGFEAIARACIHQFRLNQSTLGRTHSPVALHQARVALRRLRSALSIFETIVSDERFGYLQIGLRWIARELDRARNLDVLLQRTSSAAVRAPLQQARTHAYAAATAALVSPRLRTLILDLVEWITIGNWRVKSAVGIADQRLESFAAIALDRCRRRVRRRGRDWDRLDDEARHRLRIEAKKLRYASDFFAVLFPGTRAKHRHKLFLEPLRVLQTGLGDLNDRITSTALLAEFGLPDEMGGTTTKDQRQKHKSILIDAFQAYETLVEAKPFWR